MKLVHIKEIVVSDEHLDQNNHVNNVQYVHWVEEMAKEHWDILKNSTPFADDFWVLSDHHIQYKKQVFKGEVLTLKTYPEKPEGIRQPRKVEFYRVNPFSIIIDGNDDNKIAKQIDFLTLIYKIIIAYLIYQFIISVRQNTRRK